MTTTIKLRRDTALNWTNSNPILAAGEPGLETDTQRVKYGDGANTWVNLAYSAVGNATYANTAGTATTATTAVSAATATSANTALTAGTVTTAAQPNITSVGTLTGVVSSGNITGANLSVNGSSQLGNAATANYFVGTLHGTANVAQVAATVTTNAQPNITSVGILTGVVSTGNVTTTGYFVGDGGFLTNVSGGGSTYSNSNVATYLPTYDGNVLGLKVTSTTNSSSSTTGAFTVAGGIGAAGNIHSGGELHAGGNIDCNGNTIFVGPFADASGITGPVIVGFSAGEEYVQSVLKNSRGNGSADYTAVANEGNESEGWTSLGTAGSTFNDPNFTITGPGDGYVLAAGLLGSGGNLVLGTGDTGSVNDIVFATGGFLTTNEFARIDHSNNSLHLTKVGSKIKFQDGSIQTTAYTGGVGSELVNVDNTFALQSDGNVVFSGSEGGTNRGLVWDYGAVVNGVNSEVRQDINGLTVRAWTENTGNYTAPVNIITGQDANTNTWRFDGQGNLTVPSGSINSISDIGSLGAYITLNPDLGFAKIAGRQPDSNVNFTTADWTSATYTGTQIDFVDSLQLVNFFNTNRFNAGVNQTISINGGEPVPFTGYTIGVSNAVTVYTSVTADPDPTTVTSIDFYYQLESYVSVDYDIGTLDVNATGLTINIDNDQTEGPDINLRSGDDITLQAKDMSLGSEREGGDINLFAGDGADDDGAGNLASTGGDILIDAGQGGDGNSSSGSAGGFSRLRGGTGGTAGISSNAGSGGYVEIIGGDGGNDLGNPAQGAGGGYISITAGGSTQEGVNGASVTISSGASGPNALAGQVIISTPGSANGLGGNWVFDGNGKLTFPGTPRIDTSTNNFEIQAAENINFEANATVNIYTDGSGNACQWQFGDDGNLTIPGSSGGFIKTVANASIGIVAMDDGTNNPAQLLSMNVGSGAATSIVSAYATNATIQTNATGAINTWEFDSAGNLTLPTGGHIIVTSGLVSSGASPAPTINGFSITNSVGISGTGNISGGNISATGTITSAGKFGYASGSTVTQTTNRGNGVSINALAGTIITTSAAMVANEIDTFSVTNSLVDPNNDIILAQIVSPNQGTYNCIANPALIGGFNNGFYINIVNISGFTTSDEAITIRFMVIKAPNA